MTIEVVGGMITVNDRVLLTQRRASKAYAFLWELPGGQVEEAEDHDEALRRELREEIGVVNALAAAQHFFSATIPRGLSVGGQAHVTFYRVVRYVGDPRACEGQGIGWFTRTEMLGMPMTPGNVMACEVIARLMQTGEWW